MTEPHEALHEAEHEKLRAEIRTLMKKSSELEERVWSLADALYHHAVAPDVRVYGDRIVADDGPEDPDLKDAQAELARRANRE